MRAPEEWWRFGVRISGRLHFEPGSGRSGGKRSLLSGLGRRRYPAQARIATGAGEWLTVRAQAAFSAYGERQTRGSVRAYLERPEAEPLVLHQAPIEEWLDRWSVWIAPDDSLDVDSQVMADVLLRELDRRFGVPAEDVYIVEHGKLVQAPDGGPGDGAYDVHVHAVVAHRNRMELTRTVMGQIAREVAREMALERQIGRALDDRLQVRGVASGSAWNLPPTDAQRAVLRKYGRPTLNLTRGEASLIIEHVTGERSLYRGRDVA